MLDSLYESAKKTASELNPVADNIRKKDKEIIKTLLQAGYKKKDILNFVNVYKSDVKEYIDTVKEAVAMAKEMSSKDS